jgi:hypothetical protein
MSLEAEFASSSTRYSYDTNTNGGVGGGGDCLSSSSSSPFEKLDRLNMTVLSNMNNNNDDDEYHNILNASDFPTAPHLSFDKFLVVQDKRVVVTIIYSGEAAAQSETPRRSPL